LPENFIHDEWIMLYDNPDLRDFVSFLRSDLDRVGPAEAEVSQDSSCGGGLRWNWRSSTRPLTRENDLGYLRTPQESIRSTLGILARSWQA
jgi:hypothetical protein